jgi:ribonuclease Z
MINLTFLGTSDSIPSAERNPTSILLTYEKENILVDCGEGTQRQIRKAKLNPCKVTRLLITHWHGDHVLGIPGLLQTLALSGYNKTFFIYGPKGTKQFMKNLSRAFFFRDRYKIKVEEVSGKFFETDEFYLEAKEMTHGIPCNAYSFTRKGKIRIDKKKLARTKLPSGPLLKKLKEGKNIVYKNKKYLAKDLTTREGDKKISFVFDTSINKNMAPFVRNSDLFISEASFDSKLEEKARKHKHLTAKQAAEIAKKAKVKKLVLTHISQRYQKEPEKILKDAKKFFKNSFLVKDFDVLSVKH